MGRGAGQEQLGTWSFVGPLWSSVYPVGQILQTLNVKEAKETEEALAGGRHPATRLALSALVLAGRLGVRGDGRLGPQTPLKKRRGRSCPGTGHPSATPVH